MSRWFRVYDDLVDDPKVQRLPADTFRGLINLWCLASKNGGILPLLDEIAFKLRISEPKATKLLDDLVAAGLIEHDETGIHPHNWNGRQFKSDTPSNERVKRHRDKRKAAGLLSQWQPSKELRHQVYARDGHECVYCHADEDLTVDHKTPEIRGGTNELDNLQTTCRCCNAQKRDLTHEEFVTRNKDVTVTGTPQKQNTETEREAKASEARARAKVRRDGFAVEFENIFWLAWPCKESKKEGLRAFLTAREKTDLETIMAGVSAYKAAKPPDRSWSHAASWLNKERWNDEYVPLPQVQANSYGPDLSLDNLKARIAERAAREGATH